jgi:hypothetical protein
VQPFFVRSVFYYHNVNAISLGQVAFGSVQRYLNEILLDR